MFGKILYYDKKTVGEYTSLITGKKQIEVSEYEVAKGKGIGVDFSGIKADASADKKYTAKVTESALYDCNEFEALLEKKKEGEDYFDFTESSEFELKTVPRGSIIKIDANISIPESFDMMQLVEQFKPFLISAMQNQTADENEQSALESLISGANASKIPVIIDSNEDILLCSKLNKDLLTIDIQEFVDTDEEVTILARVSSRVIEEKKPFFDPLKDFLSLNRAARKSIDSKNKSIEPIKVDEDYRTLDVLAIYR